MRELVIIIDKARSADRFPVKVQVSELEAKSLFQRPYARIGQLLLTFSGQPVTLGPGGYLEVELVGELMVNRFSHWLEKMAREHNTRTYAYYRFSAREYFDMRSSPDAPAHRKLLRQIVSSISVHRKGELDTKTTFAKLV
jgi:hypothetical protein